MVDTASEGEEEDEEVIFNDLSSSNCLLRTPFKILNYFPKLSKEFDTLQNENDFLKKENECLKEDKPKNLSKVKAPKVNEKLQEEVIDLRQSLAKFINGSKNLKKILKNKRYPYDKSSIVYDKKKDLKKDKYTTHCFNCGVFGHLYYDCRYHPKRSSKPSKTNKKEPKRIWICLTVGREHQSWYLDNGCSHHITRESSMFQDLRPKSGNYVTYGGNQKGKIVGIDKIDKHHFPSIDNVLFVEGLKYNLLSIS
ncbi:hypothetical protein CR513_29592, partial [Mucuna pruriens]